MNRAVVIRAASGLADYLLGELDGVQPRPRVVIGYDARHKSVDFARDSAAVLTAVGIEVLVLPSALPTPVLAFAVRHLGADAGIMVTASHNPPQDNGYKVYLGGRVVTDAGQGAQIVPPADAAIAAEIAHVPSVASVPRAASGWTVLGPEVLDAYVASVVALAPTDDATRAAAQRLRIVLTPLHGVGGEVARRVLAEAGFTDVLVVPEQAEPDGDFPSVAFPNPEEPGAIDLAIGLASDEGADLVIALDPDADRCGVGIQDLRHRSFRGPDTAEAEGWRILHGDETGLAPRAHAWRGRRRRTGPRSPARSSPRGCSARSPPPAGTATRRRSRGSSGSPASTVWCSGTRRRSATASTPRTCATRTASPRRCWSPASRRSSRRRAGPSSTPSTTSPASTACT